MSARASNAGYAEEAPSLLERYERLSSENVHAHWRAWVPETPCQVLDIGAGTGRDAAWFAAMGHTVLAVEPTDALRDGAQLLHPEPQITWLKDSLPDLPLLARRETRFDLIMLNAVWMHLDEDERDQGFQTLISLLSPGGRIFMSQRHGPIPDGRRMFDVSGAETIQRAERAGLAVRYHTRSGSVLAENQVRGVEWTCLVFENP